MSKACAALEEFAIHCVCCPIGKLSENCLAFIFTSGVSWRNGGVVMSKQKQS
jgi:hypothetical protein